MLLVQIALMNVSCSIWQLEDIFIIINIYLYSEFFYNRRAVAFFESVLKEVCILHALSPQ